MNIEIADIVVSLNGRDEGKRFFVIAAEEEYASLADGKGRRLEKPKRKKRKHIRLESRMHSRVAEKLKCGEKVTNNEIKRALAEYAGAQAEEGGMQAWQRTT